MFRGILDLYLNPVPPIAFEGQQSAYIPAGPPGEHFGCDVERHGARVPALHLLPGPMCDSADDIPVGIIEVETDS